MKKRISALIALVLVFAMSTALVYAEGPETVASGEPEQAAVLETREGSEDAAPAAEEVQAPEEGQVTEKGSVQDPALNEEAEADPEPEKEAAADGQQNVETETVPAADDAEKTDSSEEIPVQTEEASAEEAADPVQGAKAGNDDSSKEEPAPEALETGASFSPEGDALTYRVLDADAKTATVTGGESGLTSIIIPRHRHVQRRDL